MKTNKKIIGSFKISLFFILFLFIVPKGSKAQVSCGYVITNNLSCAVDVTFEFSDNTCAATCGPLTINCPGNGTPTTLIGPGCCSGATEIHFNITLFDSTPVSTPIVTSSGGCSGSLPTSDSGSTPLGSPCGSTYSITTSLTGATIAP